ncbi:hypothetical protein Nepgr_013036 [Nepenthes gracilis]|uniref:Scarecrow-like protein 9 n=1 Tax=Nepenthes gracilis TaxID=150966 RepID=A0AAD3SGS7_NEPGR|nr:hypothetical protein Nepgr_013036 [Nepenthes gracilis]
MTEFKSVPGILSGQCSVNRTRNNDAIQNHDFVDPLNPTNDPHTQINQTAPCSHISTNVDTLEVDDFSNACLKFINDILMEEEMDDKSATLQDYRALQATEKSLYDALGEAYPTSPGHPGTFYGQSFQRPDVDFSRTCCNHGNTCYVPGDNPVNSRWVLSQRESESLSLVDNAPRSLESYSQSAVSRESCDDNAVNEAVKSSVHTLFTTETTGGSKLNWLKVPRQSSNFYFTNNLWRNNWIDQAPKARNYEVLAGQENRNGLPNESQGTKNRRRENSDWSEVRDSKHPATCFEECVQMEDYDDVLLQKEGKGDVPCIINGASHSASSESLKQNGNIRRPRGRTKHGKKMSNKEAALDLRTLLTHCAQAVASFDLRGTNELLQQIRQHSSPYGGSIQRVAHYFANSLEARIGCTGSQLYTDLVNTKVSFSDTLKVYKAYFSAVPVNRTSFFLANQTVAKLAEKATRIHIIDFGIFLGFQWPSLIQQLSERPTGPPKLCITGIDFPQGGFRPAERVEETGRWLARYCERFDVPFKYHAIAKQWETIRPEDLEIEEDELIVVNCQYRATTLLDETVEVNCPRDAFLRLIRNLNPNLFIHGIVNGTLSAPFFITRFREALLHYSSIFDMLEATMLQEDHERLLFEKELHGKEVLNVIACEGMERAYRTETYKQWQIRILRAGLRQLPLDQELINQAKAIVKANYHKDFVVDEDSHWMLLGWKGRTLFSTSCWETA